MIETFRMFAAYNHWANGLVYGEAAKLSKQEFEQPTGAVFGSLKGTLNHILVGDRIWMNRFTGNGPKPARLDETLFDAFAELAAARRAEDERIIGWINGLNEEDIAGTFTYMPVTKPSDPVTQRLAPAVSHFFNHQTHHRGQAHVILTTLGRASLALDLIYFQRTEEGKAWR